jgi:cellulose synthase/poly-beta-1,6-N-acetylglucosamine synthase-like glycosyltransferase
MNKYFPGVSLIITVYNEEKVIAGKIANTLALVYPKESLEIIVVSDGSSDNTEEIVHSYHAKGVKLLAIPTRHGKHYGQGKGIEMAKSDILVLSDASVFLKSDALEKIVRNFSDPEIGCVSGLDRIQGTEKTTSGEGAYVKYEMRLRTLESRVGSLVGASGSFFAIRRDLCDTWYPDISSDFYLPIAFYMKGYRSILEPEAIGYYETLENPREEFQRKVRTVVHGLNVLFMLKRIMNPFVYGTYSIQIISHKLLRWLVPICLIMILGVNIFLLNQNIFYLAFFIWQVLFYIGALSAIFMKRFANLPFFRIPFFFVMVNLSILVAWYKYISGARLATWEPTRR